MKHSPKFLALVEEARRKVKEVDIDRTREAHAAGALLVDVREDREWEAGHARGAVHLARGVLERDIENMAPHPATPIILYCGGGFRSVLAAESLAKMGYTDVRSMAGGWRAWTEAGAPVE